MANGFIIFRDGRCFADRWTGYDKILQIGICELEEIENGKELAAWLKGKIPETENNETEEMGCGFMDPRIDGIVYRTLDLRSLTPHNQGLIWKAIKEGRKKLENLGTVYSTLPLIFFNRFYKMFELSEKGEPPLEFTDWTELADACLEKNGPGWTHNTKN